MPRYEDEISRERHRRPRSYSSESPDPYRRRSYNDEHGRRGAYEGKEDGSYDRKRRRSRSPVTNSRRRSYSPEERRRRVPDEHEGYLARRKRRDHEEGDDRLLVKRHRSRSSSRSPRRRKAPRSPPAQRLERSSAPLPSQKDAFTSTNTTVIRPDPQTEKQKPNFAPTGRLAAESNTVKTGNATIVLKYHEPPESRKPSPRDAWRMYVFKDDEIVDTVLLFERSCWLIGRETVVVDYLVEHPSTSKQHAVIQFRYIEKRNEFGDKKGKVRPYIIDLGSANGTALNGENIEAERYLELRDKDVIKLGDSTREYVVQLPPPDG